MEKIIEDIRTEIERQNLKWGLQTHIGHKWNTILTEEVGEFAKAILERDLTGAYEEIIQVGALAVQIARAIEQDRYT